MTLDDYLGIGRTLSLGSYTFTAEEIVAFARKYDPQPFHLDAEAGRESLLGGLCASGWHTTAVWMKLNVAARTLVWTGGGPEPVFGPSPGFRNLKWLRPVYAGETVDYTRAPQAHRPLASRPGWRVLTFVGGGSVEGQPVFTFDGAVLVRAD